MCIKESKLLDSSQVLYTWPVFFINLIIHIVSGMIQLSENPEDKLTNQEKIKIFAFETL